MLSLRKSIWVESAKQSESLRAEELLKNLIVRSCEERVKLHRVFDSVAQADNDFPLEEVRCALCSLSPLRITAKPKVLGSSAL